MRIAIVGSGALGLYYGGLLARASAATGADVHFLMRNDYDHARRHGIQVDSIDGDFSIFPAQVYADPGTIGPVDLVLVGLKTTANAAYRALIGPLYTAGHTLILSLQNGIGNEPLLAQIFDADAIVGGVAFLCSNRTGPAQIEHSRHGGIAISPYRSELCRAEMDQLQQLFIESGVHCSLLESYTALRWRKQVWNVPFNGLCTVYNCGTGALLAEVDRRRRVEQIMNEVVELGCRLESVLESHSVCVLAADEQARLDLIQDQIDKTTQMDDYLPSMLLDQRAGRPLESDSILFSCLRYRDAYAPDLPLPAITRLVNEIERL
ncbi:MAG: 2-dehydropantoate 2-reductase [Leptospiraceae bacterium]|nr:2-dehydropantoate 2-reductase [Leptospiraceae bacterium]